MNKEIKWNIINAMLAGILVFLGGFTTGKITLETIMTAFITSLIIAVSKFLDYWKKEETEYKTKKKIKRVGIFDFL